VLFALATSAVAVDLTSFRVPYTHITTNDISFWGNSYVGSYATSDTAMSFTSISLRPGWSLFTKTAGESREWTLRQELGLNYELDHRAGEARNGSFSYFTLDEYENLDSKLYLGRTDCFGAVSQSIWLTPEVNSWVDSQRTVVDISGSGDVSLGVGYGRFRDAWPLAKAIRLIGILRDCDVLESEPRIGPLMKLADFISGSWKLFYAHDRSAKFYYDSLETLLLEARVITKPLPAYVLMKLDDDLMVGSDTREFGSQVFVGAEGAFDGELQYIPGRDSDLWHRVSWKQLSLSPCVDYRFARPLGLRWTTGAEGKYSLVGVPDSLFQSLTVDLNGSYQLTNRLLVDADVGGSGQVRHEIKSFSRGTFGSLCQASLGLGYYLTDRLLLNATAGAHYFIPRPGAPPSNHRSDVYCGLTIRAGPGLSRWWSVM
jgi:hypothetical protein